jgi:hypothetical protein
MPNVEGSTKKAKMAVNTEEAKTCCKGHCINLRFLRKANYKSSLTRKMVANRNLVSTLAPHQYSQCPDHHDQRVRYQLAQNI